MTDAKILDDRSFDILFRNARTHNAWLDKPVGEVMIHALYDLMKFGPTSANSCPARFLFLASDEAKGRLKPHLSPTNVDKTMAAPVVAIIAYDLEFYEKLPKLFPHTDARSWFAGKDDYIKATAFRNSSLQGAYLMMAARGLGLDCGPMSGFDEAGVKREFFANSSWHPNFLCNLGYGDASKLFPRNPRLGFDEACQIL